MKTFRPRFYRSHAITQLEVIVGLVVFAVAVWFFYLGATRRPPNARKAKAATVVKNIVNACKAYENEYGEMPAIAAALDERGGPENPLMSFGDTGGGRCKVDNSQLFHVLRAISAGPNVDHVLNPRKTRYFEDSKAIGNQNLAREGFTDGPEFPEVIRGQLLDPWGTQYCVVLDKDKDATVNLGSFYQDLAAPEQSIRSSAVALSLAMDCRLGGKNFEGMFRKPNSNERPDDVVSWQ